MILQLLDVQLKSTSEASVIKVKHSLHVLPIRTRVSDHFCPFLISICAEIHYPWLHLLPPLNICFLAADVQAELTAKMLNWRQPQRAAVTVFSCQTRRKITKVHLHLPPNTSASGMTPSCAEQLGGHLTGNELLSIFNCDLCFSVSPHINSQLQALLSSSPVPEETADREGCTHL